jgi:hypothetical protein
LRWTPITIGNIKKPERTTKTQKKTKAEIRSQWFNSLDYSKATWLKVDIWSRVTEVRSLSEL